jgi:hypothetical protein
VDEAVLAQNTHIFKPPRSSDCPLWEPSQASMTSSCARLVVSLLALTPFVLGAQATSLADFDLICFCNSRVSTPHFVVRMDDNGAILYTARAGATRGRVRHREAAAAACGLVAADTEWRRLPNGLPRPAARANDDAA